MQKISFSHQDGYAQEFEKFKDSRLFVRLSEKYKDKPYHQENKLTYLISFWASYLFNAFSLFISFYNYNIIYCIKIIQK